MLTYMPASNELAQQATQTYSWLTNETAIAIATFLGLAMTALGLLFSILSFVQARQAKLAAAGAKIAASEAKNAIYHMDSLAEVTKAISIMGDIQAHLRTQNLHIVPDKILMARAHLTTVRKGCPGLTPEESDRLLNTCNQILTIKSMVERALQGDRRPFAFARYNDVLDQQIETAQEVLESMKRREG